MADPHNYVVVSATDPYDKVIKNGPLLWDGETPYDPGTGLKLLLESDALEQGYVYPPPEGSGDPEQPTEGE